MNRIDDRHSHAQALWGLRIRNQTKRIGFAMQLLLASTAAGAFLLPAQTLDKGEVAQASNYGTAKTFAWFARDAARMPKIRVTRLGQRIKMPVDEVVADSVFAASADLIVSKTLLGAGLVSLSAAGSPISSSATFAKAATRPFRTASLEGPGLSARRRLAR